MYATQQYISLVATGLSIKTGINVVPGDNWKAIPATKTLVYEPKSLTYLPFSVVRGFLLHEIGHLRSTNDQSVANSANYKKYGQQALYLYNAFEDIRVDETMIAWIRDFARDSLGASAYWSINKKIWHMPDHTELHKVTQFLLSALYYYYSNRHYLVGELIGHNAEWILNSNYGYPLIKIDKDVRDRFNQNRYLIDKVISESMAATDTQQIVDSVDQNIVPIIQDWLDIPDNSQSQQDSQQGQSGVSVASGGNSQSDQDKQQSDTQQSSGQSEDQNKEEQKNDSTQGGSQSPENQKDESEGEVNSQKPEEQKKPWAVMSPPSMQENFKETDAMDTYIPSQNSPGKDPAQELLRFNRPTEQEAAILLRPYAVNLANKLRSVLVEKAHRKWRGQHQSGKLLSKNAYKVTLPNDGRVFSKQTTPDEPHYNFHIALDNSGSMQGLKATYAFMGAVLVKETCKILRFPIRYYRYDESVQDLEKLESYNGTGGGTDDTKALEKIHGNLKVEDENIVVFVTDGDTNDHESRRKIYKKIVNEKNATVFAIGIGGKEIQRSINQTYDHGIYVPDVKDLPNSFINLLRTIIHR